MEDKDEIKILTGHLEETDIMIINKAIEEAYKAGIREVVEYIDDKFGYDGLTLHLSHVYNLGKL